MMADIAFMEHVTHGWDIANATGQDATISDDLVTEVTGVVTPMDHMLRMPGFCGPAVGCPTMPRRRTGSSPSWDASPNLGGVRCSSM